MKKSRSAKKAKPAPVSARTRPPVVVVMGHVDHGKTTLLEAIRDFGKKTKTSSLTAKEHGGITQYVGAYQISHKGKQITFLDTPGHEAFAKMRSRGAQAADIAVLVVAANDGVKPQTKEAISHIKESGIPLVVAINKIDLSGASVDMVKAQLAESKILVEGYGGKIVSVPISAKKNEGIDQLLEMILLVAEMEELKADKKNPLKAYVLETFLDPRCGVKVNILIKDGQLRIGRIIKASVVVGAEDKRTVVAKIKALLGEKGKRVNQADPGEAVQVLGFRELPAVGAAVIEGSEEKAEAKAKAPEPTPTPKKEDGKEKKESNKITLILKADVAGTLEAIRANLSDEVELVGEGVGEISESDVLLAGSTGAQLVGFNVKVPTAVKKLAEMEKVKIKTYTVIYQLLEDIQKQILEILEPAINEEVLGEAKVIAEFKIKGSHVAGCKVKSGKINKKDRIRIKRGKEVLGEPKIVSFQKERQEADQVKKGDEVGIVFKPDISFKLGDGIIAYKVIEE